MGFFLFSLLILLLQAIFFHSENYAKVPNYILEAIKNFSSSFGLVLFCLLLTLLSLLLIFEEFFDDLFFKKESKEISFIDLEEFLTKNSKTESLKQMKKTKKLKHDDIESELYKKFSKFKNKEELSYGKAKKLKVNPCKDNFHSPSTFEEIFIDLEKSVKIKKRKILKLELQNKEEDDRKEQ